MAYFVVEFVFTADTERRLAIRPRHREYLAELTGAGSLVLSGPWADDTGGLLVYRAEDRAAVERIMELDPYSADGAGVIAGARITEWTPVSGFLLPHLQG
ncbi:YciI family protein [Kitasatospora sp. NPDC086801]|uniref:YciI family protein n=1 Tax=Kitasatospora sp. NPDC086801 TaxID=3364066 RepID=UPI00381A8E66